MVLTYLLLRPVRKILSWLRQWCPKQRKEIFCDIQEKKTFDQVGHLFTDPSHKPQTDTSNELTLSQGPSPVPGLSLSRAIYGLIPGGPA